MSLVDKKGVPLMTALVAQVTCSSSTPNQKAHHNTMCITLQTDDTDFGADHKWLLVPKKEENSILFPENDTSKLIFLFSSKTHKVKHNSGSH